jgi:alpha-mannosidase
MMLGYHNVSLKTTRLLATTLLLAAAVGFAGSALAVEIEEPLPASAIRVQASSTFTAPQDVHHLIDGAGMDGDCHDNHAVAATMWHTVEHPAASKAAKALPAAPAWVRFDFTQPQRLASIAIWNHNQAGLTDRGFRKARLMATADGTHWTPLSADGRAVVEIPRATGAAQVPCTIAIPTVSTAIRSVVIAAEPVDGNHGGNVYGLAAVRFCTSREVAEADLPKPAAIQCEVRPYYRHRPDGAPGREITVHIKGAKLYAAAQVEVVCGDIRETTVLAASTKGTDRIPVLLPAMAGVKEAVPVKIVLHYGGRDMRQMVHVPAQRQWTVYVFAHSHVDIGYTSYQSVVEETHKRNMLEAIKLGKRTEHYPEDSHYRWNTEAAWQVERYLKSATPRERESLFEGIRRGYVNVDASYANVNTSVCADEELMELLRSSREIVRQTGRPADVFVQTDVPGMSWGVVPVLANAGVRYVLALPNADARTGRARDLDHAPFWWVGPDGRSKVLFFQPYDYIQGIVKMLAMLKIHPDWDWNNKTSVTQIPPVFRSDSPRSNFLDGYLGRILPTLERSASYPYDIFFATWSMIDNSPPDADLPDAVRSWNEEYAYPHLVIASGHDMFQAFEKKYGERLPVRRGDFTEYWTDGVGSAAKSTGENRAAAERLIQAETLWAMLHHGQPAPRAEFDEAWRNVILGSEHTWGSGNTSPEFPFQQEIWRVKQSYFQEGHDRSKALLTAALAPATAAHGDTIAVFNTLSWPRSGLVTLPPGVTGIDGEPAQRLSSGETVFLAKDVPAFGVRNYRVGVGNRAIVGCKAAALTLENGLVTVALDPKTGDIASVRDKAGNEYVNGAANTYRYLRGGGAPATATGPSGVKISVNERGPLVASLLVESTADGCRALTREIRLLAGQPHVEVSNVVDKLAVREKEGIHFGFAFDVPGPRTRMDIPWGVVEIEKDQFPEGNRNWIAFQRWVDISGADRGVTWCALDAPMFEHGDITANIMGVSGAWLAKLNPSATIYSWALNNHWFTNFPLSQEGRITFRYRILPHKTGYDAAAANRFGMEQARPLIAAAVKEKVAIAPVISVDNPRVVVSLLRADRDGKTFVRMRSLSEKDETVVLGRSDGCSKSVVVPPNGFISVTLP